MSRPVPTHWGQGVWTSPVSGEASWVCAAGHHHRCTEVVANWGIAQAGIVLRPCGCHECRHGPEPELVPTALRLVARLEADDG